MKRRVFLFALCLIAAWKVAGAETISWNNPTTYVDNTAISVADQATITTRIYHGTTALASTLLATVTGGLETWTGPIPYTKGQTAYFRATAELAGQTSDYSPATSYTVPYVAPKAPTTINIVR